MTTFLKTAAILPAILLYIAAEAALGADGLPLSLNFFSADTLRVGEPIHVTAVIRSAGDFPDVEFLLTPSTDWQLVGGETSYYGPLRTGQEMEMRFRAIPLQGKPEPLRGSLQVLGRYTHGALDPRFVGPTTPEVITVAPGTDVLPARVTADPDLGIRPDEAVRRRKPGQAAESIPAVGLKKGSAGRGASVTVTGRWVITVDGTDLPIRKATVQLWNAKSGEDLLENQCGNSSLTDSDGRFEIQASSCSDMFSDPDLQVRLILNNSVVEVRPDELFASSYTARSEIKRDKPSGTYSFGTIKIIGADRGPFRMHNNIMRAYEAFANAGVSVSTKVTVCYPTHKDHNQYVSGFREIHMSEESPFDHEAGTFHEYGHHFLHTESESPPADYSEGGPWHPDHWAPELGFISWTEGFPDFFAALVWDRHRTEDKLGGTKKYKYETRQPISAPVSQWNRIEGVIAAILWDIVDAVDDDQDETGPGQRDNLNMTTADILKVIKDYDPNPGDPFHNHPVSIDELYDGFKQLFPSQINHIAEVYREHRLDKPLPDLLVTRAAVLTSNGPTNETETIRLRRGETFRLENTVTNAGVAAALGFTVRYALHNTQRPLFTIGSRSIEAGFGSITGQRSSASVGMVMPMSVTPGVYTLQVCADSGSVVPENNENNNCRTAAITEVIP